MNFYLKKYLRAFILFNIILKFRIIQSTVVSCKYQSIWLLLKNTFFFFNKKLLLWRKMKNDKLLQIVFLTSKVLNVGPQLEKLELIVFHLRHT